MQKLEQMSKPEKKKFFSMDLAERMIRVEQKVSASFNRPVPYNKTEYYKSMTDQERKDFEDFLKKKKSKKVFSFIALLLPLIAVLALNTSFTGNVVKENIGITSFNFLVVSLIIIFVLFAGVFIYLRYHKKYKDEKFSSHIKIIDDILAKKGTIKR